jgi:hypothetical protein
MVGEWYGPRPRSFARKPSPDVRGGLATNRAKIESATRLTTDLERFETQLFHLLGETCSEPATFLTDFRLAKFLDSGSVLSSSSSPSLCVPSLYLPASYPPVELICFLCESTDRCTVPFFFWSAEADVALLTVPFLPNPTAASDPFPNSCCSLPLTSDIVSYPF